MTSTEQAAILFDIDGTLVDSTYHHAVAWQRAFGRSATKGILMTTSSNPPEHDDPRLEVLQAVYDRVTSYEESATSEVIRQELDGAIETAGIEVSDDVRTRLAQHIDDRGGREDVANVL